MSVKITIPKLKLKLKPESIETIPKEPSSGNDSDEESEEPCACGKIDIRNLIHTDSESEKLTGNQLICKVFEQFIDYISAQVKMTTGDDKKKNNFRLTQTKKALAVIRTAPFPIINGKVAQQLDCVGKGTAERIDEIIKTGTLKELNTEYTQTPTEKAIQELTSVTGIGEAHAKQYIERGIISIELLRKAVEEGTVKITHHMSLGLKYYDDFNLKIPYDEIEELYKIIKRVINDIYPDMMVKTCGSHRRGKAMSGDIDVLTTSKTVMTEEDLLIMKPKYIQIIVKALTECKFLVDDLTTQGSTKYMGVCRLNEHLPCRRIDVRFVPYDSFFPATLHFTGSANVNKEMRTIALRKGLQLNEYGLYPFKDGKKGQKIITNSEREIFDILGICYLNPRDREL